MKYINNVQLGGYVQNVVSKTAKNGNDYFAITLSAHTYIKGKKIPKYISVMVFDKIQVNYLRQVDISNGDFAIVFGELSVINKSLSILVKDISVVSVTEDTTSVHSEPSDEQMQEMLSDINETEYF